MMHRAWLAGVALAITGATARGEVVHVIESAHDTFAPSFRGEADTTYFAWTRGSWNANPDPSGPREFRTSPTVNPAGLADASLVRSAESEAAYPGIISSSGNLYTGPDAIDMTLTIPTLGVAGTGFTTIIVQGRSLDGFGGLLEVFDFGDIDGVAAEYVSGGNADGATQWWAKWEIAGNSSTYQVHVSGTQNQPGYPLSISDLVVDTYWSADGFASDVALAVAPQAVPEPASLALSSCGLAVGALIWIRRLRRRPG
jgi:hypothetical protein